MRRFMVTLSVLLVVVGLAAPASSFPDGPDGDVYEEGHFEITVTEDMNHANPPPAPADTYEVERFNLSEGWDFGDRPRGYRCAWAEFFQGTDERFEVHYDLRNDYEFDLKIGDKFGAEDPDGPALSALCGAGEGGLPGHDGSDHFPHMIHPGDGITFFENGQQIAFLDLMHEQCDKAYWVPGDEPGEVWLWWDEDGPTSSHDPGGNDLPCNGGPGEPVAVVRLSVQNADPDIGYCTTDEMNGSLCSGPTPTHVSTVSLRLSGHLRASGEVGVADGTAACLQDRTVVLQRRVSGEWKNLRRDSTSLDGHYSIRVRRPKDGRYRAWVLEQELIDGSTCLAATSSGVHVHHG